jgi:hypothetical protein
MQRSESGAAHVSFLWVVFLIVLVLFLAGFTYVAWKDKADMEGTMNEAVRKQEAADKKAASDRNNIILLSEKVGFREEGATAVTSPESAAEKLDLLKGKFPDHISNDVTTLEDAIDGVVACSDMHKRSFDEKAATLDTEIEARREAQDSLRQIEQQKNTRIQELEGQLSDEQQRSAQQREEDNQRISTLQSQNDEVSNRAREVQASADLAKQLSDKEINTLNARILAMTKKLEVLREPDLPDGQIITTSAGSKLVYIDLGGRDGLRRGTKFDVYRYGKGGELILKGKVEVREVEEDCAMCGILKEINDMDPLIKGDVLVNPLFSKDIERTFVLLGRFPSSTNKSFVSDRLITLGNSVDTKVSSKTDFLVLGDKDQGEFAQELTETDEYKLADKLGVQIVRLNDIWDFIKY